MCSALGPHGPWRDGGVRGGGKGGGVKGGRGRWVKRVKTVGSAAAKPGRALKLP